ncbi:MAG TPA: hypothetical protein VF516_09965, partial [Kofleriaceae bacterium]
EASLAKLVPIAISLFADLIGLGGIADKIRGIIEKVQTKVDQAIDKLIARVMAMFKGGDKDKDGKDDGKDADPDVPKQLVEPPVTAVGEVNPALSSQLSDSADGKVLHDTGGDPKTVTKELINSHKDAKYDKASGTLTLPPVHGLAQAGSLEEIGSLVAQQTGVSKVFLKKNGEQTEIWAAINPQVKIEGLPTDDAILRLAVSRLTIVPFLKQMAAGAAVSVDERGVKGDIDFAKFEKLWGKQSNKDWLKEQFRGAMDGHHEWVPSNFILNVVKNAKDLAEGPKWIDLQHELRNETFTVVFKASASAPEIVDEDGGKRSVPNGHVGAVFYPSVEDKNARTKGTGAFHTALRNGFNTGTTVQQVAQNAWNVVTSWVWKGDGDFSPPISKKCFDKNSQQVTPGTQAANYQKIETEFKKFL